MDLLERTGQLAQLHAYLRQAAAGEGRLVLVGGESGIGKTSLIERFGTEVRPAGPATRVEIVSCDCLSMPSPLGGLFEIAQVLGPEVQRLLADEAPRDRLFRGVFAALAQLPAPLVLIGEDAHWIDEASLDLIRFLGRRIGSLRLLFIVTYRDDELGPYHPLRRVLGDLVTAPAVRRMILPPLSLAAVTGLVRGGDGGRIDPVALHAHTGGNPFFVTEVLAAGAPEVPANVRDAVLARASRLSPEARAVLDAAAAIGEFVESALLEAVVGGPIQDAVEECLTAGALRPQERVITFRHAITQKTILETISPPRYRAINRRILAAMQTDPTLRHDHARLAHHAEEAGDRDAVLTAAAAAARQAAVFGAHREAAAQYARALRFAADLPPEQRASLLEARSRECYLTGEMEAAIVAGRAALSLWRRTDDRLKLGDATRWLSRLTWFAGFTPHAERLAHQALAILEPLPPGPELAMTYSTLSQLGMLANDTQAAVTWGERAITLATELGERAILVHALTNVGTARMMAEDDDGLTLVERSLDLARDAGLEDEVSRALVNLAWESFIRCRLPATERYLAAGFHHTADRDLLTMERYLRAQRVQLRFAQGEWDAAAAEAEATVQDPAATALARISVLTTLGRIRACRGDDPWVLLDEALTLAEGTGELQRLGPVRVARAEAAWLAGDLSAAAEEASRGLALATLRANRWFTGDLTLWLHRTKPEAMSHIPAMPDTRVDVAEPFALELAGDWAAAAAHWDGLGFPLEAARARSEGGDEAAVRTALATFDRLGAKPDAVRATNRLRTLGAKRIPRGPQRATRANPALLTQREVEVLSLVAAGRSNREIAAQLYLTPKTAEHHVSAILAKLAVATRAEAVERAHLMGILQK